MKRTYLNLRTDPRPPDPLFTLVTLLTLATVQAEGEGVLVLTELQRAGGKRLPVADFLRGFPVARGQVLDAAHPLKPGA